MKPKNDFARFRKIAGLPEPITESIKKEKPKAKTLQSLFENKGSITRSEFNRLIKEHLEEAKKDEEEIVDTEVETTDEPVLDEPIADAGSEVDGDVKTIQDHLEASIEVAKTMGDEKLITQLGNTLTMLTRSHIVKENDDNEDGSEGDFEMFDRIEGLSNLRDIKMLHDSLRILVTSWINEGGDKDDILKYVASYIDII